MNYVVVTQEWLAARNILPLPTMRKSKDGTKYLAHEDFFNVFKTKNEEDEEALEGLTLYPHNSNELNELLASDEWTNNDETSTETADYVQVAATRNLTELTRSGIQSRKMSDKEKLAVADMYPEWSAGIEVTAGECYRCDGGLWEVRTSHTTQDNWRPSAATLSIWRKVDEESHAGTADDPIPFEQGMDIEAGKYYSQYGVTYKAIQSATAAMWNLKDIPAIVTPV